jgi:hypothetical protein
LEIHPHNHEVLQILSQLSAEKPIFFEKLKKKLNFSELVAYGDYFLSKTMIK